MATVDQIAVMLYEAIQDRKPCAVLVQPIREVKGDSTKYYLQIDGKRFPVSKNIAENAIKWRVPIENLPRIYKLANVQFTI
jgi:hypothetical protein